MNDPHSPQKSPARQPRRWRGRLRWGIGGLGLLLILALGMATPPVQRFLTVRALDLLQPALTGPAGEPQVSVGRVAWGLSPWGIRLEDVAVTSPENDTLLTLGSVTAHPQDTQGKRWGHIDLKHLHLTPECWPWLEAWSPGDSESESNDLFEVDRLSITNFTALNLPVDGPELLVDTASVNKLVINNIKIEGANVTWDDLDVHTTGYAHHEPWGILGWNATLQGTPDALRLQLHPRLLGLSNALPEPDRIRALWPDHISATWDLPTHRGTLRLDGKTGSILAEAGWEADRLTLYSVGLDASPSPLALPSWPSDRVHISLQGPVSLSLTSGSAIPEPQDLTGQFRAELDLTHSTGAGIHATGHWTPRTGDLDLDLLLSPDASPQTAGHRATFHGEGTCAMEAGYTPTALALSGDWRLAAEEGTPAIRQASGTWSAQCQFKDSSWATSGRIEGRALPVALTPNLDLFGDLRARADVNLSAGGDIHGWSGQFDLLDARWIPKAGFGGQARDMAPLSMRRFTALVRGDAQRAICTLEGDFLRGTAEGPLSAESWVRPLQNALSSAGWLETVPKDALQPWMLDLVVVRDDLLERWSGGTQSLGPNSRITARYDGQHLEADLQLTGLHIGSLRAGPVSCSLTQSASPLTVALEAHGLRDAQWGSIQSLALEAKADAQKRSTGQLTWSGPHSGHGSWAHHVGDDHVHQLDWTSGQLDLWGSQWQLESEDTSRLRWTGTDWTSLRVADWNWRGEWGRVAVGSPPSSDTADADVRILLDGFPAAAWSQWGDALTGAPLPALDGQLNGALDIDLSESALHADVQWQDARVNDYVLSDLCLEGQLTPTSWSAEVQQFVGSRPTTRIAYADPGRLEADFEDWPLSTFNPLLSKGGVHIAGTLNGHLDVDATGDVVVPDGRLAFQAPSITVDATGAPFAVEGVLVLTPDYIGLDHATVRDELGETAYLNLSVLHEDFTDWNYDLDLDFSEAPFRLMDLSPAPDRLFHGTVSATGSLNLFGDRHGVIIESELQSASGTAFVLPLDALDGADLPSGIRFTGGANADTERLRRPPFGVTLNLEMDVTPEAQLAIVLDSRAGERVDGRADGLIEIGMSPQTPLSMEGGVTIVEGAYRFSLRDLFTRRIAIAPGGRIDWDGDPYGAELNLTALSRYRANPLPLLPGLVNRGQTDVDLAMDIHGALEAPELDFAIGFPEYEATDAALLAQVQSALAAPEEVERQAFALLATGQFIPANGGTNLFTQTATEQASELLSSRVSELLSGLSEDIDIGVRYVPANGTQVGSGDLAAGDNPDALRSEDTFELDLGLNLLNDRLSIAGTVGAQGMDGFSLEGSEFRGGVDVRYKLTPDGRWEIQGYRLPESELDEEPRQGIGAAYQLRFDRLRDLFQAGSRD